MPHFDRAPHKCMNQSFNFILIVMPLSTGRIILKEKFKFRLPNMQNRISFQEPKSGFQLTFLIRTWSHQ